MRSLFALAALAAPLLAQDPVARVDDPVSFGTLGDGLLSLDEAIQVANGTLDPNRLSSAERARISGAGLPTTIEIDAALTPTIRLERIPTSIDGAPSGARLTIRGVRGRPVLDAGTLAIGLRVRTNLAQISNLEIRGGLTGIEADSSQRMVMGSRLLLDGLRLTGQTHAGMRLSAVGMMRMLPVTLTHSRLDNQATAIEIFDRSMGGPVMADIEHVTFDAVTLAVHLDIDATGNMTMCRMWRCKMLSGEHLAVVRHAPNSDQRSMLMLVASEFRTRGDTVDALGNALVEAAVHVHSSTIEAGPGRRAFVLGPQDGRIDFHISENLIRGDIEVAEGRLNRRLWAWNNRFEDMTFAVSNQGAPTSFRWNRFERCSIVARPTNSAPFGHVSSEFSACSLDGRALLGGIELENCFVDAATTLAGSVTQTAPAPSRWLADTACSTDTPAVGGSVDLTLDLPPGMLGVWQLGVANPRVVLTQEPWREYAFQNPSILVPGIYAFRSTLTIPIPNDANLIGQELYFGPLTAPVAGQTHVPAVNLPRGAHLTITR
jgi:hypothetical protein